MALNFRVGCRRGNSLALGSLLGVDEECVPAAPVRVGEHECVTPAAARWASSPPTIPCRARGAAGALRTIPRPEC